MPEPKLCHWRRQFPWTSDELRRAPQAIVFIHGIYSDHITFEHLHERFGDDGRFKAFEFFYYDYDFNAPLEDNGRRFAQELSARFHPDDLVVIIAHSMGGLVARLAVLSQHMGFVRSIFLVGTPNVGALRTAQLALAAQLIGAATRKTFAVYPRKPGIADLTRAADILGKYTSQASRADHVDYVSIPGLFFHAGRPWWESGPKRVTGFFSALAVGFDLLSSSIPYLGIRLSRPHDGIVERESNNLIPSEAGRYNEKHLSIISPEPIDKTYVHVEMGSCQNLTHVLIHSDMDVFDTVGDIILFTRTTRATAHQSRLYQWFVRFRGRYPSEPRLRERNVSADFGK